MAKEFVSQVLRVQGGGYIYQCMKKPFKTLSGTKIGAYFYHDGDLNYKPRFYRHLSMRWQAGSTCAILVFDWFSKYIFCAFKTFTV